MAGVEEMEIEKTPVLAVLILRITRLGGGSQFYSTSYITMNWEGITNKVDVGKDEEVVAAIAGGGLMEVRAFLPEGDMYVLGYEFPGLEHPDWMQEAESFRKCAEAARQQRRKK